MAGTVRILCRSGPEARRDDYLRTFVMQTMLYDAGKETVACHSHLQPGCETLYDARFAPGADAAAGAVGGRRREQQQYGRYRRAVRRLRCRTSAARCPDGARNGAGSFCRPEPGHCREPGRIHRGHRRRRAGGARVPRTLLQPFRIASGGGSGRWTDTAGIRVGSPSLDVEVHRTDDCRNARPR